MWSLCDVLERAASRVHLESRVEPFTACPPEQPVRALELLESLSGGAVSSRIIFKYAVRFSVSHDHN